MAELFSRYASGLQFTAGTMVGSVDGVSGLNPMVDRLNSISTSNNLITGSVISGTNLQVWAADGNVRGDIMSGLTWFISGTDAITTGTANISGATLSIGGFALDHGTATTDQIINVCYGTGSTPPTANTTTEGTIYVQYTA